MSDALSSKAAKAIFAGINGALAALVVGLTDNSLSAVEVVTAVAAFFTGYQGTYWIPNNGMVSVPDEHGEPEAS